MPVLPMIHTREWKKLEPLLPPTGGPGKPRLDDRLIVLLCRGLRLLFGQLAAGLWQPAIIADPTATLGG